ncbi:MAG: acyltransferase family protein [Agathobacter sp.]|nr:acyltransferase family protein [Agathobacter sp.]MBQ6812545.1 acyltransferase family protein [Agathobacter sp.]
MRERIKWIDVVKFFGIFEIYLGHFGAQAGKAGSFVFAYHVALFFLVSGCMENLNTETNIVRYTVKKIKTLLIPCFFFAFLTVFLEVLQGGYGLGYVKGLFMIIVKGMIRNTFVNQSLWFLTCLFSIQIMFFFIKKLKYKLVVLLVCFGLYYTANVLLPVNPMYSPSWLFNVDSALVYILYYAIGYLVYPWVVKLFELDTTKKKAIFGISGVLSVIYTLGLYFGVDIVANTPLITFIGAIYPIFITCAIVWAHFVAARIFQDVSIFVELGKDTLYLCGNEFIVKCFINNLTLFLGIQLTVWYPLQTYVYVIFLLVVTNKYLAPVEKYILKRIVK